MVMGYHPDYRRSGAWAHPDLVGFLYADLGKGHERWVCGRDVQLRRGHWCCCDGDLLSKPFMEDGRLT